MNKNKVHADCDTLKTLIKCSKRELLFKLLVIGDFGVGKTSIIHRYAEGTFSPVYKITIGADFAIKSSEWDEYTRIHLQLWDIAGHERFGYLTRVYYRYAVAAAIVFDLTRPDTFRSVEKWLLDLRDKVTLGNGKPIPVIILANKGDINLTNVPPHIVEFCRNNNILGWYITSAKENTNIDEAMGTLINAVMKNYETEQYNSNGSVVLNSSTESQNKSRRCCS